MGQSAGIAHSAASDITQLRKLLDDQYGDRSIFRELVQNADDAGASWVVVNYVEQGPGGHPLLEGPGVVVVNNGFFRPVDDEAIRRLGAGTKGGDAAAIGKFGLGLKSVFHLCEAFFYLASPDQEGSKGSTFCRLFNPWEEMRTEWQGDHFEELIAPVVDQTLLNTLRHESSVKSRWFALYIPLRRRAQWEKNGTTKASRAPIRASEPDLSTLFPPSLCSEVADLLPMLRNVDRIRFQTPKGGFGATLIDEATRTVGPFELATSKSESDRQFSGAVLIERDDASPQTLRFQGDERLAAGDPVFKAIRTRSDWPTIMSFDPETELSSDGPEKGEPHGAVFFTWMPSNVLIPSGLSVREAVFLPLEGEQSATFETSRVRLLLHGYYFVDSGRRALHRGKDVQTEWNDAVRRRITLPLVLPALERFAASAAFDAVQTAQLTEGLSRTLSSNSSDADALLGTYQWLPTIMFGSVGFLPSVSYQIRPVEEPYFALPESPRSTYPFLLFPQLRKVAETCNVVFENAPRLTRRPPQDWAPIADCFSVCNVTSAYEDEPRREYLRTFLEAAGASLHNTVWASIFSAFSDALAASLSEMQRASSISRDIVDILKSFPLERLRLLRPAIEHIPLFPVTDHSLLRQGEPSYRLASWQELSQASAASLLFTNTGKDMAAALQKAIASGKVLRLSGSPLTVLFGDGHGVGVCDESACIRLLGSKIALAEPARRITLLRKLLPEKDSGFQGSSKDALRYLLHGSREHFADSSSLLASDEGKGRADDVWGRLARALEGGVAAWRVVDKALADELTAREKEKLGVDSIGPAWVEKALLEKKVGISDEEFAAFVARLPWHPAQDSIPALSRIEETRIFRFLPLHETVDGNYIDLTSSCFISGDCAVPNSLMGAVTLIRNPSLAAIRAAYLRAGVSHFAHRHIVSIALALPDPVKHYREIMDALAFLEPQTDAGRGYLEALRTIRWLPLRTSVTSTSSDTIAICPCDIIDLPSASNALSRLMISPVVSSVMCTP